MNKLTQLGLAALGKMQKPEDLYKKDYDLLDTDLLSEEAEESEG